MDLLSKVHTNKRYWQLKSCTLTLHAHTFKAQKKHVVPVPGDFIPHQQYQG